MNKCVFLLVPTMNSGGQERFVSRLTYMLEGTYDTKIVLYNDKDILYSFRGDIISLNFDTQNTRNLLIKILINIIKVIKLKQLIKKYRPVASISFGQETTRLNILAKSKGCKAISSIRGYSTVLKFNKKNFKDIVSTWSYKHSDKIICVSESIKEDVASIWPNRKKDLYTLYNGFDCKEIRTLAKKAVDLSFQGPYIVAMGTMKNDKGYWHLLKAFSIFLGKFPEYKLMLIGPDLGGTYDKLKKEAEDLKINNSIIFMGLQKNPYKYLSRAELFVMSSIHEGFPNALVEAMACGLPVLSTDCKTGPREILAPSENRITDKVEYKEYGILTPPLNSKINYNADEIEPCDIVFGNAIIDIIKNSEKRAYYSKKSIERAEMFSYSECKRRIIGIIEN